MKSYYGPSITDILHLLFWSLLWGAFLGLWPECVSPKVLGKMISPHIFLLSFRAIPLINLQNWDWGVSECSGHMRNHSLFKFSLFCWIRSGSILWKGEILREFISMNWCDQRGILLRPSAPFFMLMQSHIGHRGSRPITWIYKFKLCLLMGSRAT